ncbi:hypothetical protein [Streptomyces sp. NPDC002156]
MTYGMDATIDLSPDALQLLNIGEARLSTGDLDPEQCRVTCESSCAASCFNTCEYSRL